MMLPQAWFQLLTNIANIFGVIGLIFYSYAWLGISKFVLSVGIVRR